MTLKFIDYLQERDWLLADGATGTNLFNKGLSAGEAPELWNVDAPEKISAHYQEMVDAGADIFLTNSFGGNASRLKLHAAQDRVAELNIAAAKLGRAVADAADRPVYVAGSMGPTGELMEPLGALTHEDAVAMFHAQGEALLAGGADLLWVETLSALDELAAAAEAIAALGAPWCATLSFDTAGRSMMGVTAAHLSDFIHKLGHQPLAFGANCGVGASDLLRTIQDFAKATPSIPLIAKGNAGIPKYVDGHIHYDGTPELMAKYAVLARDSGAKIIGGCCGTMPKHLVAMRSALETTPPGPPPEEAQIVENLGGFSSETSEASPDAPKRARRRRQK